MAHRIQLSLTDDLMEFVKQQCGDGTLYMTPQEYICDLLREKKECFEAARIRDKILDGYEDMIAGRTVEYRGNLRELLRQHRECRGR